MREIHGKTALVTGAASGIGRAIALRLADEGARLYLIDRNIVTLAEVVAECHDRRVDAVARYCDVAYPVQITAAVNHLLDHWGGLDLLVNNAGITYYGRTSEMSAEHWSQLLAVNLHAPIQFTRELLPTLLSRDESHILNVASICGLVGLGRVAAYTTTKFGLVGFSESLRAEYVRQGLGVTALCPGFVDTNLFAGAPRGHDVEQNKMPPKWLLAQPEAIADRAMRAIYRNQGVVVLQSSSRLIHLLKRVAPGLIDLAHRIRRHRRKQSAGGPEAVELQRRAA